MHLSSLSKIFIFFSVVASAISADAATSAFNSKSNTEGQSRTVPSVLDSVVERWIEFPLTFVEFKTFPKDSLITVPYGKDLTLQSLEQSLRPREIPFSSMSDDYTRAMRLIDEARYNIMIDNPRKVVYVQSTLPDPPELKGHDHNYTEDMIADIPEYILDEKAPTAIGNIRSINWLHSFNGSVQFSQAYLSPNWYQGGNNSLSLLTNLLWNVKLNEVYHPNLKFDNTFSYKLALNSTPQDLYHKYSVSEDIFQWNFLFGVKAVRKWFYSFTAQFKTQFLNTYGENSMVRKAAFMSPGSLTLGLGMTYSFTNKANTLKFNTSISPLSYNLIACIDPEVDPTQYNVALGRKTKSEIGSNAELTLEWNISNNVSWRSRLFTFTDYHYFLGDWENTFNFTINRFLSTQVYVHLRYDSSTEIADISSTKRWRYWMLKEILSFGFSYTFSTK